MCPKCFIYGKETVTHKLERMHLLRIIDDTTVLHMNKLIKEYVENKATGIT